MSSDDIPLPHSMPDIIISNNDTIWWWHICGDSDEPVVSPLPIGWDGWRIKSIDPITIGPSINCKYCSFHAFFEFGRWYMCKDYGYHYGFTHKLFDKLFSKELNKPNEFGVEISASVDDIITM